MLWRPSAHPEGDGQVQLALVHRPRYDDWSFPKGKLDRGETHVLAALREVREETGHQARPGRSLPTLRYHQTRKGRRVPKEVRYWVMRSLGGRFTPGSEVDELEWLDPDAAARRLTYRREVDLLTELARRPVATRTVLLVRHALAVRLGEWRGDDAGRPLSPEGRTQAERLVPQLAAFGVTAVVSGGPSRCRETVAPLAHRLGLAPVVDERLSETGYPGHEREAVDLVRGLGAEGSAAVACSQGGVLPDLLTRLGHPTRMDVDKAAACALSFVGDRLVDVAHLPPPPAGEGG